MMPFPQARTLSALVPASVAWACASLAWACAPAPIVTLDGPDSSTQSRAGQGPVEVRAPVPSPQATPRLVIASDPRRGPLKDVTVARVAVEAQVVGHLGETRMTLTFSNPNDLALAGDLVFPLPPEATVSGYALDVAGRMVDGVVVPKDEARRVFELEVRKGVDPGLVEHTRGNVFKTRVFPIPARGTRTIRLAWVGPLEQQGAEQRYHLPLAFPDRLTEATIRIDVLSPDAPARLETSPGLKLAFDGRQVAETTLRDRPLVEDLRVIVPARPSTALIQTSASGRLAGGTWFSVRESVPPPADLPPLAIRRVALLWDASMSRREADREREVRLLSTWLRGLGEVQVDLTVFRDVVSPAESFAIPSRLADLEGRLRGLTLDGATRLDLLAQLALQPKADAIVVVSDGLATLGPTPDLRLPAPAWFLSSSQVAAHATLKAFAAANGGAFHDLPRVQDADVLASLGRPVWSLLAAEIIHGSGDVRPVGPEPVTGPVHVSGQMLTPEIALKLSFGVPGQPARVTRVHQLRREDGSRPGEALRFAWAQSRLNELAADPTRNAEAIRLLGETHGLVTPGTSLIVLETLEQYLTHDIEPPDTWPEMHAEWHTARSARAKAQSESAEVRLREVAEAWAQELAWYAKDFRPVPVRPVKAQGPMGGRAQEAFGRGMGSGGMGFTGDGQGGGGGFGSRGIRELGAGAASPASPPSRELAKDAAEEETALEPQAPQATIAIRPWDPEVPWTKALKAEQGDLEARYLALRDVHGEAPSFYLDVAEFFLTRGDRALGLRILSNLAELRLDEPALLRVLGHRLAQLDALDLAVFVFEHVKTLRPEEPQSFRDLALVLGRRGLAPKSQPDDLARAVGLLAEVVKRRWDRFEGIESIALHEMNRLIALERPGTLGPLPLDARVIHATPLDLRITMSWDADLTDMDIHVLDPRGEEALFSNNLTAIGGRVSRDFTQGYGPETFSLRKAIRGAYEVKTRFFASDALALAGSVTLQVELVTDWGRPTETRQAMTLRLTEAKEDFVVGRVSF